MDISSAKDNWDIFISHASEDKTTVAIPLTEELQRAGLRVWLDVHELTLGDSLRAGVDKGLGHSRFGVVILSEAFFAKDWPERELNAFAAFESKTRKVLLPILHGISHEQAVHYSPLLADKLSISTDRGIQQVALEITNAIRSSQQEMSDKQAPSSKSTDHCLLWPAELVGTRVGSYKLGEHLGAGGSGVVFRASHRDLGDQLAIKIFYPLAPEYEHFNSLFEHSFRALSRLKYPNIVSTIDFGRVDLSGLPVSYLVMDFIAGQPLDNWSYAVRRESEAQKMRLLVAKQLVSAMVAAHETNYMDQFGFEVHGVLHGDLKPANVIVSPENIPIIMDFMIVDVQRLLDPQVTTNFRIRDGTRRMPTTALFGTPGFMAPEQAEHGIVTVSTDVYGLGVTLCHLFLPNQGSPQMWVKKDTELPEFVKELLSDMTATKPDVRPESMKEVLRRLSIQPKTKKIWHSILQLSKLLRG